MRQNVLCSPTMATPGSLAEQERIFAAAFAANDLEIARPLYDPGVVYVSPTTRLYAWPRRIEGIERTLEFIALTVSRTENVVYRPIDVAITDGGKSAFVHVDFEWGPPNGRLRCLYVVLYHYRGGRIVEQRIYYDPTSGTEPAAR